jgi:hypothetical protein
MTNVIDKGLVTAIANELNISVRMGDASLVHVMYRRNRSPSKSALSEAIRFVLRKECTLAQSNNILTTLAGEGIFL